ncbi:MAG: trypsin-like peptidase domain-containing protein [Zavarzinella sp.]
MRYQLWNREILIGCFALLGALASALSVKGQEFPSQLTLQQDARHTRVVEIVKKVQESIVNIHSEKTIGKSLKLHQPREIETVAQRVKGMGTGIIIDPRGYILTNHHVIEDVELLRVNLQDGTSMFAKVIARNPAEDLAILKVNPLKKLPTTPLGTNSDLMLAEPVIAIGNAYGYEHTVTTGIISSLKRDVSLNEEISYKSLIQTSAGINPGNSGGPLLNVYGELIGVNVAIRANAQNIAFALPIDRVLTIAADMMHVSRHQGRSHGLVLEDKVDAAAHPVKRYCIVKSIDVNSPAAASGLKVGDRLTQAAGIDVRCALDLERACVDMPAESKLTVVAERDAQPVKAEFAMKSLARAVPATTVARTTNNEIYSKLGIKLTPVSKDTVTHIHQELKGGMLVTEIDPNGLAKKSGVQLGDVMIGLHIYETLNEDNILFVLNHPDRKSFSPLRFHVIRGRELHRGWFPLND